jgi:hypothetical protein
MNFDTGPPARASGALRFYWRHAPGEPTEIVFDYNAYTGFTNLDAEPA